MCNPTCTGQGCGPSNGIAAAASQDMQCIKVLGCRAEKISKTFKHSFVLATASASDYVVQAACRYFPMIFPMGLYTNAK